MIQLFQLFLTLQKLSIPNFRVFEMPMNIDFEMSTDMNSVKSEKGDLFFESGGLFEFPREAIDEEPLGMSVLNERVLEELQHNIEGDERAPLHRLLQLVPERAAALRFLPQQIACREVLVAVALLYLVALRPLSTAWTTCSQAFIFTYQSNGSTY